MNYNRISDLIAYGGIAVSVLGLSVAGVARLCGVQQAVEPMAMGVVTATAMLVLLVLLIRPSNSIRLRTSRTGLGRRF